MARKFYAPAILAILILLMLPAVASAETYYFYQGNRRDPGYGVKANISTPTTYPDVHQPGMTASWVTNLELDPGQINSAQCGWIVGDGVSRINGVLLPVVPKSYIEISTPPGGGDLSVFILYTAQPLEMARTYEVVNVPGTNDWKVIVAGQTRPYDYSQYRYNQPKLPVLARTEIQDNTQDQSDNRTHAHFSNVQYKGQYSYMPFDQQQWVPDYGTWFTTNRQSLSQYQTSSNGAH